MGQSSVSEQGATAPASAGQASEGQAAGGADQGKSLTGGAALLTNGAAGQAATGEFPPWATDLDPDDKEWLGKAGHKDLKAFVKSHRNLESLLGADKAGRAVVLPKDENDQATLDHVLSKLGRPETPDGYGLEKNLKEGVDPGFAKAAAAEMHKLGLTAKQAQGLQAWHDAEAAKAQSAQDTAFQEQADQDVLDLRRGWGPKYDEKIQAGIRAARQFGFDEATLARVERAIGTKALLTKFAQIGAQLGEDVMPGGAQGAGAMGDAKSQIEALKHDKEFQAKRQAGDAEANRRWDHLHQTAFQDRR